MLLPIENMCPSVIKWEIQLTLINLHSNECNQELHYYPFPNKLNKYDGNCNTLNDLSNRVFVPNEKEDLNIHVFNMNICKNETNILTKCISCKCKNRFDEKICNSDRWWNNDKCLCECKLHVCEKDILRILLHAVVEMQNI